MADDGKRLGVTRYIGPLRTSIETLMQSNNIPECIYCGTDITEDNDSGWEAFTEDGYTSQAICTDCYEPAPPHCGFVPLCENKGVTTHWVVVGTGATHDHGGYTGACDEHLGDVIADLDEVTMVVVWEEWVGGNGGDDHLKADP